MSTISPPSKIYTNPLAATYKSISSPAILSNKVYDFHTSLPTNTRRTLLVALPNVSTSLNIKTIDLKDESNPSTDFQRFRDIPTVKALGLSWAIRNGIIAELSESLSEALSEDISLQDLAAKAREAQIKLIAASDGHLGFIVARLGKLFGVEGINTRIFIPSNADEKVSEDVKREGAEAIVVEGGMEEAVREAWLHSVAVDGVMIAVEEEENYEDIPRWIVEGYSTVFKEVNIQLGGRIPDWVVVPVGDGGLAQAAVMYYKAPRAEKGKITRVLTVEPSAAASLHASLKKGEIATVEVEETVVEGLRCGNVSKPAWQILRDGVDASVVVDDEDIENAVKQMEVEGVEAGPCSAAVLAGLNIVLGDEEWKKEVGMGEEDIVVLIGTE
ncbi:hypothetical protein VTL71DRAFT_15590 [Oculimacula yallundae]|uniref:Tryptophan synthase beta chain-like PALP domain-containing protein n=1 Tax=Oculimacula yallundae TaxID=86028 RepID=A0ABR4CHT3_9HELO